MGQKSTHEQRDNFKLLGCFKPIFMLPSEQKHVQLYIPVQVLTDSTQLFGKLLEKELKRRDIISQKVEEDSLQTDLPLFLVCPLSSRTEACVDHALEGFQWKEHEKFAVVLLHFGIKKSLPENSLSKELPAYKNARFIDVAFNKDDKLYKCDMNKAAFKEIKDFVDSYRYQHYIG